MKKLALVCVLGAVLAPTLAHAQVCMPGLVATDATAGHCCWPGQAWSEYSGRCTGAPACPAGFAGAGNECVSLSQPSTVSPAYIPFERHPNYGVIGGGTGLFVATYLSSLVMGLTNAVPCANGPGPIVMLVPFSSFANVTCGNAQAAVIGIAFGLGQLIGVVLMALGDTVFQLRTPVGGASVSLGRDGFTLSF